MRRRRAASCFQISRHARNQPPFPGSEAGRANPKMIGIGYTVTVDTDENERKLELMHENIRKYGTIYNTVAAGTELTGVIRRAGRDTQPEKS